jgi:hypothetical protein
VAASFDHLVGAAAIASQHRKVYGHVMDNGTPFSSDAIARFDKILADRAITIPVRLGRPAPAPSASKTLASASPRMNCARGCPRGAESWRLNLWTEFCNVARNAMVVPLIQCGIGNDASAFFRAAAVL